MTTSVVDPSSCQVVRVSPKLSWSRDPTTTSILEDQDNSQRPYASQFSLSLRTPSSFELARTCATSVMLPCFLDIRSRIKNAPMNPVAPVRKTLIWSSLLGG